MDLRLIATCSSLRLAWNRLDTRMIGFMTAHASTLIAVMEGA